MALGGVGKTGKNERDIRNYSKIRKNDGVNKLLRDLRDTPFGFTDHIPFKVVLASEINYEVKCSKYIKDNYSEERISELIRKVKNSIIRALKIINHFYPSLLDVQPISPTNVIIYSDDESRKFEEFDVSFYDKDNGVYVIRTKAYVSESNIDKDMSPFVLYDLLSKCYWTDVKSVPYGLDFGARKFLMQSFMYRTGKGNVKVNWLTEEVVAAFFALLLGMDKFVKAFVTSSSEMLRKEILKRTNDEKVYPALCVYKHNEILQFIFFIISEPNNNFPDVEEFITFGKKHGYDFSRLFELLADLPKYKHLFEKTEEKENIEIKEMKKKGDLGYRGDDHED